MFIEHLVCITGPVAGPGQDPGGTACAKALKQKGSYHDQRTEEKNTVARSPE